MLEEEKEGRRAVHPCEHALPFNSVEVPHSHCTLHSPKDKLASTASMPTKALVPSVFPAKALSLPLCRAAQHTVLE